MTLPGVDFACKVVLEEEKHYHVTREIFSLILVEIEGVVLGRSWKYQWLWGTLLDYVKQVLLRICIDITSSNEVEQ